jgi:hypothetical protein
MSGVLKEPLSLDTKTLWLGWSINGLAVGAHRMLHEGGNCEGQKVHHLPRHKEVMTVMRESMPYVASETAATTWLEWG